jgi:hypothetical protein
MDTDELARVLDTLAVLGDHERALAALYTACGALWRDDVALWHDLAASERGHADCLSLMADMVSDRPAAFAPGRPFTAAAGRLQVAYVEGRTRAVEAGGMARRTALLMAREIERSIIETRLDELLETDDPDYLTVADRVVAETRVHYRLLERELQGGFVTNKEEPAP